MHKLVCSVIIIYSGENQIFSYENIYEIYIQEFIRANILHHRVAHLHGVVEPELAFCRFYYQSGLAAYNLPIFHHFALTLPVMDGFACRPVLHHHLYL